MRYQAIIFDLDGTAIASSPTALPSAELIGVVATGKTKTHLCAATGRNWANAQPVIQALTLSDPCIIGGGAQIISPTNEEILWQGVIPGEAVTAVLDIARTYPYQVAYTFGLEVVERHRPVTSNVSESVNTIYVVDIPFEEVDELVEKLQPIPEIMVAKAHSWTLKDGLDLHITHKEATKEHAVTELCRILGIDPLVTVGVGDGYNDIHLFNAVGHRVAMGNAVESLKAAADEVIASVDENGLAAYIATL